MLQIANKISKKLIDRNQTLSVAESCTGGLIGGAITSLPGVSQFFRGGVIAYDNQIKQNILGVERTILAKYGAVSSQTVKEMARGVKKLFKTDYSISVSGIAGPDGGAKEKPVGLVWIAVSTPKSTRAFKHRFKGNRQRIRYQTIDSALEHLIAMI